MPAAFPVLTTTSRVARTEVCAGAIKVSWATGWPSAWIATQEVFSARISTVKVLGGFAWAVLLAIGVAAGLLAGLVEGSVAAVEGFAAGLLALPPAVLVDAFADAAGGVVAPEGAGAGAAGWTGS